MEMTEEPLLTVEEIATKLKCSRGWVQLTIDAGCRRDEFGRVTMRDFMLFQLSNIHKIRQMVGLRPIETALSEEDLRPNVKALLTTQLEWLQLRSSKDSVKRAAKLVCDRLEELADI